MNTVRRGPLILLLGGLVSWSPGAAHEPSRQHHPTQPKEKAKGQVRITMEELHRHGGTPLGWKFTLPAGDPQAGREIYIKLECYSCHQVQGEQFPTSDMERRPGPDLTGMGGHHPADYFAEAVLDPNAVIVTGPGHTGEDGLSIMPSYTDLLTLEQWIDLVAYLKSLTARHDHMVRTSAEAPKFYEGEGEVRIVQPEEKLLVVKHGEIKGFMGAMTMGYPVSSADLLKGLKKGDRIMFKIDARKEVIIEITPVK
ncbi:MAG: copper-binding protein [Candidatus Methylomirabilales bacterium]